MSATHSLDGFDTTILAILQKDNTTPLRVMADEVHLSTASIQRRIKRLKESGIIRANTAVIEPETVGQIITIIVEVHTERTSTADWEAMKKCFSGPEIQQCYYVTGDADFMLILTVANMAEYEEISQRLFYENPNVKWFRTIVVMDRVKVAMDVPLTHTWSPAH